MMKTYLLNGEAYTEDEVIAIHDMWQDIQDHDEISECLELALAMIGNDDISEFVRNNKRGIIERCLNDLPEWGVWQDECLSQHCLLRYYLVADKVRELYEDNRKEF